MRGPAQAIHELYRVSRCVQHRMLDLASRLIGEKMRSVAVDNALSVILSYTDLMLDDVDPSRPWHADLACRR
jgi:hypothetical protein